MQPIGEGFSLLFIPCILPPALFYTRDYITLLQLGNSMSNNILMFLFSQINHNFQFFIHSNKFPATIPPFYLNKCMWPDKISYFTLSHTKIRSNSLYNIQFIDYITVQLEVTSYLLQISNYEFHTYFQVLHVRWWWETNNHKISCGHRLLMQLHC